MPGGHVHEVRSQRPEYSYRDIDGIDDEEIGIDQEVAADIGHVPSLLLAELPHQPGADCGDFILVFFPKERAPTSNRPAPDPVVFLHRMTVTEDKGRPAERGLNAAGVDPQAVDVFEVRLVSRPDVVSIKTVLDQQLPVGLDRVSIGTGDDPHAFFGLVDDKIQILPSSR